MNNEDRIANWREGRKLEALAGKEERTTAGIIARDQRLADAAAASAQRAEEGKRARIEAAAAEEAKRIEVATSLLPSLQDVEEARDQMLKDRREASRQRLRTGLLSVGIPTLITAAYFAFIATPFYEAHAVFSIQTGTSQVSAPAAGIFSIGMPSSSLPQAFETREFILSREMMNAMNARYGFANHYRGHGVDPLSAPRIIPALGIDEYSNYLRRVHVDVDIQASLLTVSVEALTPADAVAYVNDLLALAQARVDEMSQTLAGDRQAALSNAAVQAETEYLQAASQVSSVQKRSGELSPQQTAATVYQVIGNLETQAADAERQHDSLLASGLTESPLLAKLTAKASQIRTQIAKQRGRLMGGSEGLQGTTSRLDMAMVRRDMARDRLQSSLRTVEQGRLNDFDQRRYLMVVAKPVLPSIATVNAWPYAAVLVALLSAMLAGTISIVRLLRRTRSQ